MLPTLSAQVFSRGSIARVARTGQQAARMLAPYVELARRVEGVQVHLAHRRSGKRIIKLQQYSDSILQQ